MSESPILIIAVFAGALYLFKLWRDDMLAAAAGKPNPKALPGAVAAGPIALAIGAAGALVLVLVETAGEMALGVSAEQTDITGLFLLAMIGAGVLEEVIFRGYLVVQGKGRRMLVGSIIGFSLLFALLHYQYYIEIPDDVQSYVLKHGRRDMASLLGIVEKLKDAAFAGKRKITVPLAREVIKTMGSG